MPCECAGEHGGLRNRKTRFDSSAGYSVWYRLSSECAGFARDPAKVEDQVQFLARTLDGFGAGARRDGSRLQSGFERVRLPPAPLTATRPAAWPTSLRRSKSLSSSLQRAFQRWLNTASVERLLSASIGNDPSLRDILRLARPTPADNRRRALFGWLTGKETAKWAPATEADLPEQVQRLVAYRRAETPELQAGILARLNARWDLLADAARGPLVWKAIARQMGPQALRMNLNTLLRHEVFATGAAEASLGRRIAEAVGLATRTDDEMVDYVAARIADADEIRRSRQFPYQYLAAYLNAGDDVPRKIKAALHKAAEIACGNIPELPGPVVIGLDVSGSMSSPVTGHRGRGATSKMRCVDVAALFAAAILRRNPESIIVPFDDRTHKAGVDPQDSILSLAERLAKYGGGGTNCSLPLAAANRDYLPRRGAGGVLDRAPARGRGTAGAGATAVMTEWQEFVKNQLRLQGAGMIGPKLVCINLQPYGTTQAPERSDILNIGGFSDAVFGVVAAFLGDDAGRFVAEVESVEL